MATASAASSAADSGGFLDGGRLARRLGEIAANSAPEEMLEPALRAIVTEGGAAAGALCFFDSRQELLRLAVEVGLSDDGCRQLRCVRRGVATGWDIPLHGLLNRRAYLIDSAARNRYVPPLVEPASAMRAIVCVPLYAGPNPLGSLILVAVAPRSFAERDVHALEGPVCVLVKMMEATRRRGGEQPPRPASAPAAPPPANPDGAAGADRVQLLIASLAATERERSRLAAALEAGADERAEQARTRAALEARATERAAEVARLTQRLEAERARFQALEAGTAERAAEVERLTQRLASEQARSHALEAGAAERAAEVARLMEQLGAEQARLRAALDTGAAERATEVARLTEQLEAEQARLRAAEARRVEREVEVERLTEQREAALAREGERSRRVGALGGELTDLRRQPERETPAARQEASAPESGPEIPSPAVKVVTPMRTVSPREDVVAIVDSEGTWPSIGSGGAAVTVISPADLAVRLTELAPGRVVANLAAPGTLEALAALRAAGWTTPVRGCLAATAHAVPLGAVEVIRRPLDSDAIEHALGAHAARGARVLIVGTDVDFFVALREALGRRGLSVSMAWDAHQVDDLLAMVRPDITLIDLALGARDIRPIAARLTAVEPVPTAVLILGTEPGAPDFSAVMTYPIVAARAMPLDQLLVKLLGRGET